MDLDAATPEMDMGLWNLEVVMREAPIQFPVSNREGSREFRREK